MNELVLILISTALMFISHEILRYLSLILMGVKLKTFYISKKGVGFIVDNQYMKEDQKLLFFFLFPSILSLAIFIDIHSQLLLFFSILNILWSLSDIGTVVKIKKLSPKQRMEWADRWDDESLNKSFFTLPMRKQRS